MRVAEASAVVPLSPEEAWDLLIGDQMHRLVEMPDVSVVAVEDYLVRPDGTARYTVANKAGPTTTWHTADFTVYERPHRSVNRVLDSPFGGTFYGAYEPTAGGTRVTWRWEIEPQTPLTTVLLPVSARCSHSRCNTTWTPSPGSEAPRPRNVGRCLPGRAFWA